nr:uncharacterized protein LOC108130257 [Drosophila bipectinata]XP_043066673.1 uncharacterized protein LOC108130257 [Drosophila bipectinata]
MLTYRKEKTTVFRKLSYSTNLSEEQLTLCTYTHTYINNIGPILFPTNCESYFPRKETSAPYQKWFHLKPQACGEMDPLGLKGAKLWKAWYHQEHIQDISLIADLGTCLKCKGTCQTCPRWCVISGKNEARWESTEMRTPPPSLRSITSK